VLENPNTLPNDKKKKEQKQPNPVVSIITANKTQPRTSDPSNPSSQSLEDGPAISDDLARSKKRREHLAML
jgi:hypothetical protein